MRSICALAWIALLSLGCGPEKDAIDTAGIGGIEGGAADTTAPVVSLDTPNEGATVSGEIALTASASDDTAIAGVVFYVDGAPLDGERLAGDDAEPWTADWDTSELINGNWHVSVQAVDPAGNLGEAGHHVWVDNDDGLAAGSVEILTGGPLCGVVEIEAWADPSVVRVDFAVDGDERASDTNAPFAFSLDTTTLDDGDHQIRATASDDAGRQAQHTATLAVDNGAGCDLPPQISLDAPAPDSWHAGDVEIAAAASDADGVDGIEILLDGVSLGDASGDSHALTWDSTAADEGWHVLSAIATDAAGDTAEARINVGVDRTAPEVTITAPADAETLSGEVQVTAEVGDEGAIASVELFVDGVSVGEMVEVSGFLTVPFGLPWDTTDSTAGDHSLSVVATDEAGNAGTAAIGVVVDNPPLVTIDTPADSDQVSGEIQVDASAGDDSAVVSLELFIDGVSAGSIAGGDPEATGSWGWDTAALPYGDVELTAVATDDAGQTGETTITVRVNQPGEIDLLTEGTLSPSQTLAAHGWDDQDIAQVAFELDGSPIATVTTTSADPGDDPCALTGCDYYATTWDTTGVAEGTYTLTATLTNVDGESVSDSSSVTVDYDQDGDGSDSEEYGGDDCDDTDGDTFPGSAEICDGADQDCDLKIDEGWDYDDDGIGNCFDTEECDGLDNDGDGATDEGFDSDADGTADCYDSEGCDGLDNDGDGAVDESMTDTDGDGTCDALDSEDCDGVDNDGDSSVDEGTSDGDGDGTCDALDVEECDGLDNDGDSSVDEGFDGDGDGTADCFADEVCDGADNDGDGAVDEGASAGTWYADGDGDGYGDASDTAEACEQPPGYVDNPDDCDDSDVAAWTGAPEICDGVDNDCDGATTEDGVATVDGAGVYATVQDAIDAGSSGSRVVICDGTYTENLLVYQDITLESLGGADAVTIDGSGSAASVIRSWGGHLEIVGLTLTNGTGTDYTSYTIGGAIFAEDADSLTVTDSVITGNSATYGGGILGTATGADAISGTEITGNDAVSGGGAYLFGGALSGVTVSENIAALGGGLFVDLGSLEVDAGSVIQDNYAADAGGGVYLVDGAGLVGAAVYDNESGDWGGGVFAEQSGALSDLDVQGNVAAYGGGGLLFYDGTFTLDDSDVLDNDASSAAGAGGGVWAEYVTLTTDGVTIDGNTADAGAGLLIYGSDVTLTDSAVTDNSASRYGSGAYLYDNGVYAGHAEMTSDNTDWGSGGDDNVNEDVELYLYPAPNVSYTGYASGESFGCSLSAGSCL